MSSDASKKEKLPSSMCWYSVALADRKKILNEYPSRFRILWPIWTALLEKAHFKRSLTVTLADDLIARDCGLSRSLVNRSRILLKKLKMVKCSVPVLDPKTKLFKPTVWTLKPSVKPFFDKKPNSGQVDDPCNVKLRGEPCNGDKTLPELQTLTSHSLGSPTPQRNERCGKIKNRSKKDSHSLNGGLAGAAPEANEPFVRGKARIKPWQETADEVATARKAAIERGGK